MAHPTAIESGRSAADQLAGRGAGRFVDPGSRGGRSLPAGPRRHNSPRPSPADPRPACGKEDREGLQPAGPWRNTGQSRPEVRAAPSARRDRQGTARADPKIH